jgi:hypothetical protein
VKLILPIESMIGRASNLVMSICSTGLDSSSALRVSLIRSGSCVLISVSVVIENTSSFPRKREIPLLATVKKTSGIPACAGMTCGVAYSFTTFERLIRPGAA